MIVSEDSKTSEVACGRPCMRACENLSGGEFVTHLCGVTEPDNGESAP